VAEGQDLAILEAMKMESPVKSPSAGKVSAILIKKGDSVSAGQAILYLE